MTESKGGYKMEYGTLPTSLHIDMDIDLDQLEGVIAWLHEMTQKKLIREFTVTAEWNENEETRI